VRSDDLVQLGEARKAQDPETDAAGDRFGSLAILRHLQEAVPRYISDVDQGKLIYPACKRTLSDKDGDVGSVWDQTRLEAIRYVMMVPGREFELLIEPNRQLDMINAYLVQRPHGDTVIDFTGTSTIDFSIAIFAGLNWLRHCAQLAAVLPAQQVGTIRNFRRVVRLAQRWWACETGSISRSIWPIERPRRKIGRTACRRHPAL